MTTTEQNINDLIPLTIEGKDYTGIFSGLSSRIFRSVDISALQNEPGWIYDSEGRMEPWKLEGMTEEKGSMIFYGPPLKGREFSAEDLDREKLEKMIRIFQSLRDKNSPYQGFYSRGWVFLEDGRILLLPNSLMEFIRKSDNEQTRMNHWYPFNHPDRSGLEGLEFTTALLAASILRGSHPYAPLESEEDNRNEQLRRVPALSPDLMIPGLKEEIADVLTLSFKGEQGLLKKWIKVMELWKIEGALNPLKDEERQSIEARASQLTQRGEINQKRRQIWRRKSTVYMISAAVIILIGVMISTPIKKSMEPPMTLGMAPLEVVEAYYAGFNSMDQELMEDCIDKKIGKGDLNEVMNFFVTSRVRLGYEGKTGVINAGEWVDSGRPALEAGTSLYGVALVDIQKMGDSRFRVDYEKWMPGSSEDIENTGPIPPVGYLVRDLLTLEEQKKGNWLIVGMERSLKDLGDD